MKDQPVLIVHDEFIPFADALKVRETLVANPGDFQDTRSPADGVIYPTVCQLHQPAELEAALKRLHGGADVRINLSCYRLGLLGEKDDTAVHVDSIYESGRAAVWYLSLQRFGGTAFHRHGKTGYDYCPTVAEVAADGRDPAAFFPWLDSETLDKSNFEVTGFVGSRFNRVVSYPTKLWHSRVPNDIGHPFGRNVETGRLIWVAFYDVLAPESEKPKVADVVPFPTPSEHL